MLVIPTVKVWQRSQYLRAHTISRSSPDCDTKMHTSDGWMTGGQSRKLQAYNTITTAHGLISVRSTLCAMAAWYDDHSAITRMFLAGTDVVVFLDKQVN